MPDPPPAEKQQQQQNHQDEGATNGDAAAAAAAAASLADSSSPKPPAILTATTLGKTYLEIVQEGIADMKDRTGSSLAMIKKWIAANYGSLMESPHFISRLNKAIRSGVTSKKLIKVRASYKNTEAYYKKINASASSGANGAGTGAGGSNNNSSNKKKRKSTTGSNGSATAAATAAAATVKKDAASTVKDRKSVDAETAAKKRKAKAAEEERQREKERFELAERLKKRRFPMDDTQLHAEDKELKVKPPSKVKPRPMLPYFWHVPLPLDHPDRRGKTPGMILTYSKADFLDVDSRGLVADLLQVYHFFRGDVHFDFNFDEERGQSGSGIAPEFTLRHLICAVHQVLNGQSKKIRLVPPLIVHLFVTSLQILLSGIGSYSSPTEAHMYAELHKYLGSALTPVSWSDICHLYMDAMERYYTTEASLQPNVLETEPLTVEYLLGKTDTMETTKMEESRGYLGHTNGSLYKAHHKLAKQDPWTLTAEELMALLRALTEDVLALHPEIMDHRDERLQELVKNKREADTKYRKVRLAYEGPVKKQASNGKEAPFKPTTSRRQFDAAKKAQEQADAEYQKGRHNLIARTVPIGQDRNFNDVYCFRNDPDIMYVEERRPAAITNASLIPAELQPGRRSWYAIETMSLFDSFVASLDVRGKRENDLYNELVGKPAESLRQYLIDDVSSATKGASRLKEMEVLEKRLEEVRLKCLADDSERRSSRKTLQPEDELREIETELATLRDEVNAAATPSVPVYDGTN
jgi:histone H1/5